MATRQRPGDLGAEDARGIGLAAGREIRLVRRRLAMSLDAAGRRAGMSGSQFGRIERGAIRRPTLDQLCRASRAVGLKPWFAQYPSGEPVRDAPQLALLARFERLLASSLRLRREVPLPVAGDLRAWDGRITDGSHTASVEGESKLDDVQAVSRRIELKRRDDPDAGAVILVVNRTAHNRRVLAEHRESLRGQLPLDGAAIARELRRGRVPPAGGIIML
jgi:transcriptional regulator with XRE-family HTH domain